MFAESFCELHEETFHTYMMLEAYHCLVVKKPSNVGGYLRLATEEYITTIAEFMQKYVHNCFMKGNTNALCGCQNPVSNKVYQSIGFVEAGRIADIKFDLRPYR
ncbi:MAG TPA: hypothetical protein DEA91_22655 [Paenibacillus sp.]|nr:hypothetical protein [Paenibacillus sp.]